MASFVDPQRFLDSPSSTDLVGRLLQYAYEVGASDIHLVPTGAGLDVLLRCDGELSSIGAVRGDLTPTVIGRLKVLADLLVYRTDIPQEGRIPRELTGIDSEVRLATYPALLGEKVAVRLDAQRQPSLELGGLGLPPASQRALVDALEQPEGVILLTGPSGSGKTTTLYSCLQYLVSHERRRSIVTVEDPVERRIEGVVQTEVNETVGVTYGAALSALLRQDPEVILVGEIRDRVTAAMALEAGLTGHLIASTVHAGTAPQVFARLMEMGIEPFAITSVVRGVMSQRLLRRRCPAVGIAEVSDHSSCAKCQGTGYHGRVLVAEWLPMTDDLRRAILARCDAEALAAAAARGGYRNLRGVARDLVISGVTTQQEVDRVLGRNPVQETTELVAGGGGGPGPVPPDAGRDVPGPGATAEGAAPVIPRPEPGTAPVGGGGDGAGCRSGHESAGSV